MPNQFLPWSCSVMVQIIYLMKLNLKFEHLTVDGGICVQLQPQELFHLGGSFKEITANHID